jgi:hypothetical protein
VPRGSAIDEMVWKASCSKNYSFGTLCNFDAALDARYGTPTTVAQYVEEAQVQDYENTRASVTPLRRA